MGNFFPGDIWFFGGCLRSVSLLVYGVKSPISPAQQQDHDLSWLRNILHLQAQCVDSVYCLVKMILHNSTFLNPLGSLPLTAMILPPLLDFCSVQPPAFQCSKLAPALSAQDWCPRTMIEAKPSSCSLCSARCAGCSCMFFQVFLALGKDCNPIWRLVSLSLSLGGLWEHCFLTVSKVTKSFPKPFQQFYGCTLQVKIVAWLHFILDMFLMPVFNQYLKYHFCLDSASRMSKAIGHGETKGRCVPLYQQGVHTS